ncbi:unnamed protein product [Heligmosomoides polygyrus]|uniref:G_PROTEIN_RECEP_F1_2 domain-containing protein n=1 Tax=Heligmosomoides polygyrus TaxID=6339 RepID=A0A183FGS4_HELPZ|nr:unnamed protein product [Heligmosomoides polygyrus]
MDYVRLASILAHTFTGFTGIVANSVLIFLILKRTPSQIAAYSILIFNFALWDLLTCAGAVFVQQSLLFSFCYRYYVLEHESPAKRTILLMLVLVYTPSFFQFVSFCFASDDSDKIRRAVENGLGYNMSGECVSGHLDIMKWKTLFTILHMTVPVIPVYITILLLRRAIISKLSIESMSQQSRQLHSQLLKFGIWHNEVLESANFILFGFITMLNPMVSLYFITPYREWIRGRICRPAASSDPIRRRWTSQLSEEETRSRVNAPKV